MALIIATVTLKIELEDVKAKTHTEAEFLVEKEAKALGIQMLVEDVIIEDETELDSEGEESE